jgi:phospholipase C
MISPYARANYVDHTLTDQSSVSRFIEDNWLGGERLGGGSFDAIAGSLDGMFDWQNNGANPVLTLDPKTGEPAT